MRSTIGRIRAGATIAAVLLASGCAEVEDVSPRRLAAARARWDAKGPSDYDLDWESSGPASGRYRVAVRGGEVRSVCEVGPDGREREVRPADPSYYSVDGLFRTLEEEAEQLLAEHPFGREGEVKARPVFEPHPRLGYPLRYRREVLGDPDPLTIEVRSLDPVAPEPPAR